MAIPWTLYLAWFALSAAVILAVLHVRGRPRPITIGLLVVLGLGLGAVGWRQYSDVRAATRAARIVVGSNDVSVRCLGWFSLDRLVHSSQEGWVPYGADGTPSTVAYVDATQCRRFRQFAGGSGNPDRDSAVAVEVVIHESVHLAGVTDEAETTCRALAQTPRVMTAFGREDGAARAVVNRYLHEVYAYMPEEYQRPDHCAAVL